MRRGACRGGGRGEASGAQLSYWGSFRTLVLEEPGIAGRMSEHFQRVGGGQG